MKRVMITGGPGSGKSTLARIMGEHTELPVYHMDHIHWKPGWVQRETDERLKMVGDIEAQDRWIFEGGFSKTYENRARRADTPIWLDLPVMLRLWRVIRRTFQTYGQTRPDLTPGCVEAFDSHTLEFWHYVWRTRRTTRERVIKVIDVNPNQTLHHLQSRSQVAAFIANLPAK